MKDLFGNEITIEEARAIVRHGKKRRSYGKPNGYAGQPGRGSQGEFCRTCAHAWCRETGSDKRFWKCDLIAPTRGPGTDIRLKSPACQFWKKKTDQ